MDAETIDVTIKLATRIGVLEKQVKLLQKGVDVEFTLTTDEITGMSILKKKE